MGSSREFVVLFDGVCNLCNGAVQFIIKRDKNSIFKFASLQSTYGQAKLKKFGLPTDQLHSFILVEGEQFWQKSDAALMIAKHLGGTWKLLSVFTIVPSPIRNKLYTFVANNRYRFFGKKNQCMIPSPELKSRFIA